METEEIFDCYEAIIDGLVEHNYAVVDGLFTPEVLNGLKAELIRLLDEEDFKLAGIGKDTLFAQERAIRSDKIHWIDNRSEHVAENAFVNQIYNFSQYLNRTCFTGIQDFEFHYACFERGNFYKRHFDRFKNDESRKFSVVTYLNEDWTADDGGALVLYLDKQEVHILPKGGRTVIFKSELIEHEVLPAGRNRYSVTGWLK
ncbi:2OG-Fe(II) oxygenase [Mangrovibacterium lignilyticum]|uniref:2OG-Fe(II) oxygenase n=1 Tax=Mangrovibacterium lignilyticum TaxID=2668052 RepID=UPI0013D67889|nr:2OG-Fe(II) oxygenase [Mangrovibacterium lignilyticum]